MCMGQNPPKLSHHQRLVLDVCLSDEPDHVWLLVRQQDGFSPIRDIYSDYATIPVAERVIAEWEGIIGAYLEDIIAATQVHQRRLMISYDVGLDSES